jgi:hypothetical protein
VRRLIHAAQDNVNAAPARRPAAQTRRADPEAMFPAMWMSAQGIRNTEDRKALAGFITAPASR